MNAGQTKTGLGLNRKGEGTTQTKNGHHRMKHSVWVSLSCPKCPGMWSNKVLLFLLSDTKTTVRWIGMWWERGEREASIIKQWIAKWFCLVPCALISVSFHFKATLFYYSHSYYLLFIPFHNSILSHLFFTLWHVISVVTWEPFHFISILKRNNNRMMPSPPARISPYYASSSILTPS